MGVDLTAAIKGALPFPAGASPASPGPSAGASPQAGSAPVAPALTLEQYASLCVDLQNPQADAAAVLRRYSLTPETKRALDSRFSELFHRDPAQNAAFQQACVAYRAWLARGAAPRKT